MGGDSEQVTEGRGDESGQLLFGKEFWPLSVDFQSLVYTGGI